MTALQSIYQTRYQDFEVNARTQALLRCVPKKGRMAWARVDMPHLMHRKTLKAKTLPLSFTSVKNDVIDLMKGGFEAGIFATACAVFLGSLWMIG